MSSVNKAVLLGNLGKDPESRSMSNGGEVVSFTVATSETWTRDGQKQERTEWHNVVIFNEHLCKIAKQYLRKGSKVYLEGAIQTRKWADQNGNDRYTTEIVLQKFKGELVMLGEKSADAGRSESDMGNGQRFAGNAGSNNAGNRQAGSSFSAQRAGFDDSDEIPF